MKRKSVAERAKALVGIARPDFREASNARRTSTV
jgi:acyl-CoA hydrolase